MRAHGVSAVILAGGRSSRFGRNKLAEPVDGRALLDHVVEAVRPYASEILVIAAPGATPRLPEHTTLLHDPVAFEGPLAGLLAGLRAAAQPAVLVVGGDMPTLVGAVLDSMLDELDAPDIEAVVLAHEGRSRPLPMALRRDRALAGTARLVDAGERRLRALPGALTTRVVPEETWRALDPDGLTVRDIDTQADLD
jgi:molybdopterin-guanine dinucleotide biosynthesis protein A